VLARLTTPYTTGWPPLFHHPEKYCILHKAAFLTEAPNFRSVQCADEAAVMPSASTVLNYSDALFVGSLALEKIHEDAREGLHPHDSHRLRWGGDNLCGNNNLYGE
jgi:hypothetical protein